MIKMRWVLIMNKKWMFSTLILLMLCVGLCQAASEVRQLTYDSGGQFPLEWSPNSEKILYASETNNTWNLWVMNADGSAKVELTDFTSNSPNILFFSAWSPDGKKIAYTDEMWSGIVIAEVDGSGKEKISSDGILLPSAWSPDGSKIAYTVMEQNVAQIWIMNSDGLNKKQIVGGAFYPKWSPDGSKIAYWTSEDVCIWVMNPDGSERERITTPPLLTKESGEGAMFFYWSPDGTRILYHSDKLQKSRSDLWVVNTKTGEEKQIVTGGCLGWTNKDRIIYSVEDEAEIRMINPDGSGEGLVLEEGFMGLLNPDGSKLAFVKSQTGEHYFLDEADIWVKSIDKLTSNPILTPTTIATATPEITPEIVYVPQYEVGTYWFSERYAGLDLPQSRLMYVSDITEVNQVPCYELTIWVENLKIGAGFELVGKIFLSTEHLEIITFSPGNLTENTEFRLKLLDFPLYIGKSWTSEYRLQEFPDRPVISGLATAKVVGKEDFEYYGTNDAFKIQSTASDYGTIEQYHYVLPSGDFPGSSILDVYEEAESGDMGPEHIFKLVEYGKITIPPPDINKNNIPDLLEDVITPTPTNTEKKAEVPSVKTTPTPEQGVRGFEAAFAIAGLLAVAYFGRQRRVIK
jgi:Tol biopolymer transport system component